MKTQPQNFRFLLMLIPALAASLLSACAPGNTTPTATAVSVEAIYTSAAQTLRAQFSQTAAAKPSASVTPTVTITPTGTITPTKAPQYFAPLVVITPTPTTSGTPGPTPTATFGAVGCNNSAFLADLTIPGGTFIAAGDSFTKIWSIQNTGTCSWNNDFKFTFIDGDLMNSDTFKIRRTVSPNASTEISVELTAPTAPGTYTGYWRMASDSGALFGVAFAVSIKVAGATFTPTTEVNATDTATSAPPTSAPATFTATVPAPTAASPAPTATFTLLPPPPTETPTLPPPTETETPTPPGG